MSCKIGKANNREQETLKKKFLQICYGIPRFARHNGVFQTKYDLKISFALMIWQIAAFLIKKIYYDYKNCKEETERISIKYTL